MNTSRLRCLLTAALIVFPLCAHSQITDIKDQTSNPVPGSRQEARRARPSRGGKCTRWRSGAVYLGWVHSLSAAQSDDLRQRIKDGFDLLRERVLSCGLTRMTSEDAAALDLGST